MGGACCKEIVVELNPDGTPKDPQDKDQEKNDPRDLRNAAKAADWAQMRMLLRRMPSAQINSGVPKSDDPGEVGYTALHYSVSINHLKGVRKLVRYTHSVHTKNAEGKTPLHFALETGKLKVASFLLSQQANVNDVDAKGGSPFLNVVASGRRKLACWIVDECQRNKMPVNFDQRDGSGNTAVLYAAKYGWHDLLKEWVPKISEPAKVLNVQNSEGETVLGWVLKFAASGLLAKPEAIALAKLVLDAGARGDLPCFAEKVPPIHLAAATDYVELYKAVEAAGGNAMTQLDALGRSALHFSAARGAKDTSSELLALGIKPYALDQQRNTPLHLAAMRGQEATISLLMDRADDKTAALLTPNKDGLTVYHLALMAGSSEPAQKASLKIIEQLKELGNLYSTNVYLKKDVIKETPLLLAVGGHQDLVVKKLLELGADVNQTNHKRELPLSRNLGSITAATYDSDAAIFNTLIEAGSITDSDSQDDHPLLAICKNNLSNFAEKAVKVLKTKGELNWQRKDSRGYTPLMLAAFHDNAWLVRYIIDEVGISPNDPSQRTLQGAPMVVGSTGAMCCKKPIISPGTIGNQTPLMCAAKGASLGALKILLQRGADVSAIDGAGRTALAYAMTLDKIETLECARVLLAAGSKTKTPGPKWENKGEPIEILDITGESWVHRAVRYGADWFIELWARHQGCLEVLASTPEDCDTMPDGSLKDEQKKAFIDSVPTLPEPEEEQEDELIAEEDEGEDSEDAENEEDGEAGPVAEGLMDSEFGMRLQELIAKGLVETFYPGPSPKQMLRWRRQGNTWWNEFWVDAEEDLPPVEFETDLDWQDTYNYCDAGEEELDYEEILDVIRDQEAKIAAASLPRGNALRAIRTAKRMDGEEGSCPGSPRTPASGFDTPTHVGDQCDTPRSGVLSNLARRLLEKANSRGSSCPSSPRKGASGPVAEGTQSFSAGHGNNSSRFNAALELNGVISPMKRRTSTLTQVEAQEIAEEVEGEINRLAFRAARQLGLSDEVMRSYGLEPPSEGLSELDLLALGPGPVAEGKVEPSAKSNSSVKSIKVEQSFTDKALMSVQGTPGAKLWANEPYYQPDTRYQGVPKYMDEKVNPWWPKVDCADQMPGGKDCYPEWVRAKIKADSRVTKSKWNLEDPAGPWNVPERLKKYRIKKEKNLSGAALRMRNIKWYLKSMSPDEFPLKPGQWKSVQKKTPKAVEEAAKLHPRLPNEKAKIRKKKAWFGIPDLPFRPEYNLTSPLVMAVRMGRTECVKKLTKLSNSINIPDGFGLTAIQYAMLLLVRDRHNKAVQCTVDTLLEKRPFISARMVVDMYLYPRASKAVEEFAPKALAAGMPKPMKRHLEMLELQKAMYDPTLYQSSDYPTVMDPLVLGTLLNDMPRVGWMVFKCGGNLNDSFVGMQDIPTYFQGLFEKMCGRTQSKVYPLHIGIFQKKFETVRLLLDMGADPNTFGKEFTGNVKKDIAKKAKLLAQKMKYAKDMAGEAAKNNPCERVWRVPQCSLFKMFGMMKAFICSIEIPGITRPHPWVSALHLSCRLGQASITFLLLKRGAAPNGSGAAAFAPKSPLEEALAYARNNCQSYNALSDKLNYKDVRRMSHLDDNAPGALAKQASQLADYQSKLMAKAEKISAKERAKNPEGNGPSAQEIYDKALGSLSLQPNTLALFGRDDLAEVAIPNMSPAAMAGMASAAVMMIVGAFADPTKLAMKAAAMAAKVIIKIYFAMMKRPIAHWDPAIQCAHVMFYHRAPYNPNEKQTSIVLRDMCDNATYDWMALDKVLIADPVWKPSAVNKILAVKSNDQFGYKVLDMTPDHKAYKKANNKLNNAIEGAYYNVAISHIGTSYMLPTLVEFLEGKAPSGKPNPVTSLKHLSDSVKKLLGRSLMGEMVMLQEKVLNFCETAKKNPEMAANPDYVESKFPGVPAAELVKMKAWGFVQLERVNKLEKGYKLSKTMVKWPKKGWADATAVGKAFPGVGQADLDKIKKEVTDLLAQGKGNAKAAVVASWPTELAQLDPAFAGRALASAQSKLPLWYIGLAGHKNVDDCLNDIAKRFTGFDPAKQKVVDCDGLPVKNDKGVSMNPFDLMLSGSEDSFKYKEPEFPVKAMAERGRKTDALTMADIVKAIQAAYIQIQAKTLREEQQMRAQCFYSIVETTGRQRMEQVKAMVAERGAIMKEQAEKLANFELMDWTEEDVINASMNKVNFDIAAAKLGPKGQMVVQLLQEKLGNEVDPSVTSALVDVAKDLGAAGLDKGTGVLVDKLGAKVPDILPELKGNFLSQLNEACVNFDPNALNFGAMLEGGKDEAMAKLPISPEMKGAATKMLDELLDQGTLSTEAFDELMAGGVDSLLDGGVDMMLEKLQKKLPKGMKLNEDDVSGLKDMALAGDVDGMLDMGADMAEDMAGAAAMSMVSKSKAGKAMLALDKKMANNPVLGALYKEMKGQMAGAGKDCLDQIMNMENPSLPLPEFMQDMSLPSLDSLEGALDGMGDSIADALENANFEVLEEAVLGMELDMSMDFEALIEALEEARDALVSILEFLDMDVV